MVSTTEAPVAGTFARVDPKILVIGTNVRIDTKLGKDFVDSIREHGVLEPITVELAPSGTYEVLDGQRRTLAALEANVADVPIYIRHEMLGEDARVIQQVVVNAQREDLTKAERVGAVNQLTLFGLPAGEISKKLGIAKADVEHSQAIAASPKALEALENHDSELDLVQAATLVEFQDDKKTLAKLIAHAGSYNFDSQVREARRARALAASKAALVEKLKKAGTPLIKQADVANYSSDTKPARRLDELEDDKGAGLTVTKHKKCPGHSAYISEGWYSEKAELVYVCTDWASNGHRRRTAGPQLTAEEREAEDQRLRRIAERRQAEQISAELRSEFITQLLQRDLKKLPDVEHTIAQGFVSNAASSAFYNGDAYLVAAGWFGIETTRNDARDVLGAALNDTNILKPLAVALAVALGVYERAIGYSNHITSGVEYFRRLESWGHTLSDVERAYIADWEALMAREAEGAEKGEPEEVGGATGDSDDFEDDDEPEDDDVVEGGVADE